MIRQLYHKWYADFWRIFRFGITGTICSAVHYGVYCLVLCFLPHASIAYTAGYAVGLVCNYACTTWFTFQQKPTKKNLAGFICSHLLNYLLEIGLLNLFLRLNFSQWLAPVLVMIIVVPVNFLLLRFVFVGRHIS